MAATHKGTEYVPYTKVVDLMHRDTRLMKTYVSQGTRFSLVPGGGAVRNADAKRIIARRDVISFDDGLFPGNAQTWAIGAAAAAKPLAGKHDVPVAEARIRKDLTICGRNE
jgi:hypothetical protein